MKDNLQHYLWCLNIKVIKIICGSIANKNAEFAEKNLILIYV